MTSEQQQRVPIASWETSYTKLDSQMDSMEFAIATGAVPDPDGKKRAAIKAYKEKRRIENQELSRNTLRVHGERAATVACSTPPPAPP